MYLTRRDNNVAALPSKVLECLAHHDLGLARRVVLRIIEEVNAQVIGLLDTRESRFVGRVATKCHPTAQADGRNVQPRATEATVHHAGVSRFRVCHCVVGCFCLFVLVLREEWTIGNTEREENEQDKEVSSKSTLVDEL